jgi:hypothetical protein
MEPKQQVAALRPLPPVPSCVRKLPAAKPVIVLPSAAGTTETGVTSRSPRDAVVPASLATDPAMLRRPAVVAPLAPERFKVQLTIGRDTHDKLRQV